VFHKVFLNYPPQIEVKIKRDRGYHGLMDKKVKWYWWKAHPERDLAILEKYPEFVHLSKKGKWSRIQYRLEEKVVS